jgi:hypothetical protein
MRSRLEASFAAHLDELGFEWRYEPRCYASIDGQYLPDFLVKRDGLLLFYELKPPTADTRKAMERMHVIRASEESASLFVVVPRGTYPYSRWQTVGACLPGRPCAPCRGEAFTDLRCVAGANRTVGF